MRWVSAIFDGARTKISQLAQLVVVDDEPLSNVDGAALDAELKARKAWAERRQRKPEDGAIGKLPAPARSRAPSERLSTERARVVHRDRDHRAARAKAAADDAFRRVRSRPRAAAAPAAAPARALSSSGGRAPRGANAAQVTEWYKQLDVQPGADRRDQ